MDTIAVTFYDVVVWLHVSSVVVAFGPTFAFGIYVTIAARKDPRSMPTILEAQTMISRSLLTIGGILVLITGLYLVLDSETWEFSDFFVAWGILAILVLLGLAHGFFFPTTSARCARLGATSRAPGRPAKSNSARSSTNTRAAIPGSARSPA